MTAQIGVLNRKGIALATDSAVTVGIEGKEKAFNTAEKLFEFIKGKPIGIMIYNNADFIGVPWEIIIKNYRKDRQETSFNKLQDYCKDFFEYLSNCTYLLNEYKSQMIMQVANFHLSEIFQVANDLLEHITQDRTINAEEAKQIVLKAVRRYEELINKEGIYIGFEELNNNDYLSKYNEELNYLIDSSVSKKVKMSKKEKCEMLSVVKKAVLSNKFSNNYTGIVITGYGEKDIFPRLYEYRVEMLLDKKIKKNIVKPLKISTIDNDVYSRATIRTFAQAEMAQTYISGMNPGLMHKVYKELGYFLSKLYEKYKLILDYKRDNEKLTTEEISELELTDEQNAILEELGLAIKVNIEETIQEEIQENYITPFIEIVDSLDKQQLAELAENLVNLTSFKRKMSIDTETVGGPIDVVVISKGEGFIWIKRKYYFDSELNPSYIRR